MKAWLLSVLTATSLLFPSLVPAQARDQGHVQVRFIAENASLRPGTPFRVALRFHMDPGWHIYGKDPGDTGLPTTVHWNLPPGFTAGDLVWPAPRKYVSQGSTSYGYEGDLSLVARVTPPADLPAAGTATLRAQVSWLACRVECTPGRADLALTLPVGPGTPAANPLWSAGGSEAGSSAPAVLLALALAFLGGLILNLMPCVLPVISLKVLSFVKSSGDGRALRHGLLFGAGVLVSFWIVAAALLALRAGGQLIGWGFQFQSPAIVAITAALFFLIGLNLLGVFEVIPPVRASASPRNGAWGSFLSGLLATVVATPCTAPFMGAALGYALTRPPGVGMGVFTALALGLAAPYVVLSALPGLVSRIPRPGPWMVTLRQVLAFPMLAAVIWMMYVLDTLAGSPALLVLLGALLVAGLGAWIYGRWGGMDRSFRSRLISAGLALVLVVGATAYSALRAASAPVTAPDPAPSSWEQWSPQRQAELLAAGTPVFVDFSAQWCLTCQVNERVALRNPEVLRAFRAAGVALLRADWTDRNDTITRALGALGRAGVPVYALYPGGSSQPVLLPELLTPGTVLEALKGLR